jgi:hypothetical protein
MFYCKQRTYKLSMCKNKRTFDAKRTQIEAKKRPKTAFCVASERSLGAEKALPVEPNVGLDERRIQPSALHIRRRWRPAPGQATGVAKGNEPLDALH